MPSQQTGGKYLFRVDQQSQMIKAWLYNFEIGGSTLKKEHTDLLDSSVGPIIEDGGSIALMGLASSTGTAARDFQLGSKRLHAVLEYLQRHFGHKFLVAKHISAGKTMALAFKDANLTGGTKDNQESELWRAVVINAWNRSMPLPPPAAVDDPFNNPDWSKIVGQVLDTSAGILGIIDVAADIAEVVGASAAAIADLIVGPIAALASLPLTWGSADFYAENNGKIQGKADAIQDMADQFKDASFDTKRLADWPVIQVPQIHSSLNPQPSVGEIFWRQGKWNRTQRASPYLAENTSGGLAAIGFTQCRGNLARMSVSRR
jgi:hypothetical protein